MDSLLTDARDSTLRCASGSFSWSLAGVPEPNEPGTVSYLAYKEAHNDLVPMANARVDMDQFETAPRRWTEVNPPLRTTDSVMRYLVIQTHAAAHAARLATLASGTESIRTAQLLAGEWSHGSPRRAIRRDRIRISGWPCTHGMKAP